MIAHKSLIVSSKSLLIKNFFYGYLFNAFKYSLQKKLLVPFIVKTHYVWTIVYIYIYIWRKKVNKDLY